MTLSPQKLSLACLEGKTIVIFGVSGWFGQVTLGFFLKLRNEIRKDFVIIGVSRVKKSIEIQGFSFTCTTYEELEDLKIKNPIVFHYAYGTPPSEDRYSLESYAFSNIESSIQVARFIKKWDTFAVVYTSSGAVYKTLAPPDDNFRLEKNPYGILKLYDEGFFDLLSKEFGFKLIVPRIFAVSGPCTVKRESYALSNFIDQAKKMGCIHIKSNHPVYRSFVPIETIIYLCRCLVLDDKFNSPLFFDICSKDVVEIGELAQKVMEILDIDEKIIRDFNKDLPRDFYNGSPKKFLDLLDLYKINLPSLTDQIRNSL
jgi:nucleoside-diphosphate-sugar epimerase